MPDVPQMPSHSNEEILLRQSKTILVTGSSTGIGRALAEHLARKGHRVFASMRAVNGRNAAHAEALRSLAQQEGLQLAPIELDVSDAASIEHALAQITAQTDRLDVLINNAGIMTMGVSEATSVEQVRAMFDVNVLGAFRMCQAVLPRMRQQQDGLLVWISSMGATLRYPFMGLYGATKAAFESMAEALHYEVFGHGIDTVIAQAGLFATSLADHVEHAAQTKVAAEYGIAGQLAAGLSANFRSALAAPRASSPAILAEAVAAQIQRPKGQRTLHLPVGAHSEVLHAINPTLEAIQAQAIPSLGMAALLERKPRTNS